MQKKKSDGWEYFEKLENVKGKKKESEYDEKTKGKCRIMSFKFYGKQEKEKKTKEDRYVSLGVLKGMGKEQAKIRNINKLMEEQEPDSTHHERTPRKEKWA